MKSLKQISSPVQTELKQFDKSFASSIKSNIPLLNIITNYIIRQKGKQIRPLLIFLSAKLNGIINDSTYTAASLAELLHTATLIHDDVVDESYERRGFLSINALWKSKIAVLFGDYLLAKGLTLSIEKKEHEILGIFTNAVNEMIEGELLQIQKSRKLNISETEYFDIIRKKTAALISACTSSAVRSVTDDLGNIEIMKEFGLKIGMAFQIKDDLFDYEKQSLIGKPRGNDIQEKKLTLPLISSLEFARKDEKQKIIKLINKKSSKRATYNEVFEFVHQYNGVEYAKKKMYTLRNEAVELLMNYPKTEIRSSMIDLVNFIVERSS
jgi:octaprenyl-diphosphate synthase